MDKNENKTQKPHETPLIGTHIDTEPLKVEIDLSMPLPRIPQYHLKLEGLEGPHPIIQGLLDKKKKLLIPTSNPCNTPMWAIKKKQTNQIGKTISPRSEICQ